MRTSEIVQCVHSCAEGTIGCELRFGPIGRVHSRTIGMCVSDQHCVYTPQPVLREPFHSRCLEALADINDNGPEGRKNWSASVWYASDSLTYFFSPSLPRIRRTADVFRYTTTERSDIAQHSIGDIDVL